MSTLFDRLKYILFTDFEEFNKTYGFCQKIFYQKK